MNRHEIAPGAHHTAIAGEKFKRFKVNLHFVLPGERDTATALAVLPHILERRCAAVPEAMALSRRLFDLYGAELTGESYTAGPNRVVTLGISGLKNTFALAGEDVEGQALALLLDLCFSPYMPGDVFDSEDVDIERSKQADYLKNEMNDKRGYCLRQARRRLYGDSPLGIESAGYLEDIQGLDAAGVSTAYQDLLRRATLEVVSCGVPADAVKERVAARLAAVERAPAEPARLLAARAPAHFERFTEPMDTVQGKLCLLYTNGRIGGAREEATMRMASAVLGGLPTSRLHENVREKQSLCYYCASVYGSFSGTLQMDSGVDHANTRRAAAAMEAELKTLQSELIRPEELENARKALAVSFTAAGDSPDAMAGWAFNELLRGTHQTLEQAKAQLDAVTREDIRDALAAFKPALEYTITAKEGV